MNCLATHGSVMWHAQMDKGYLQERAGAAATLAGHGNDRHFSVMCRFNGFGDIGRVPAGGNGHKNVAGLTQRADLALEDGVEAVIVADCGQYGGVGVQGDSRERKAIALEAANEFGYEVLGVGGRATIAASENLRVVCQGAEDEVDGRRQRFGKFARTGLQSVY